MNPIETLMTEHRLILQVIDALAHHATELKEGWTTERGELTEFATFLREFADVIHHGKEEDLLFAAMVESGFPNNSGPIGVMLHEHVQGRNLTARLAEVAQKPGPFTTADREAAVNAALAYSALLQQHIGKEDRILYPMAESHLPADRMDALADACASFDASHAPEAERLVRLAEALIARHREPRRPAVVGAGERRTTIARSDCDVCGGHD